MISLPFICNLPEGYRWGAWYQGSIYYLIRESDNECILVEGRIDLYEVGNNSVYDPRGMTPDEIRERIEEGFVSARGQNRT